MKWSRSLQISKAFVQSPHLVFSQRTCSSHRGSFSATVFSFFNTITRYSTGSGDEFGHSSKRRSRGPAKKASKGENVEEGKHKHTVDLRNTMRANALAREPELQKLCQVFKRVVAKNDANLASRLQKMRASEYEKGATAYGADVSRLWVSSVDYTGDVMIGPQVLRQMSDIYRKLRGTLRFLLGNLHDWKTDYTVPYHDLPMIDKHALFQLENIVKNIREGYENYQFFKIFQTIQRFVIVDLSNFYFDVAKDRLYVGVTTSFTRRSCQTVLAAHLLSVTRVLAPILPHLAEDVWQNLPFTYATKDGSVAKFPVEEVDFWGKILELRTEVDKFLEIARTAKLIGSSLEAKVYLHTSDANLASRLQNMRASEYEKGTDTIDDWFDSGYGAPSYSPACTKVRYKADVRAFKLKAPWTRVITFTVRNQDMKEICWAFNIATLSEYTNKIANPESPQITFSALRIAECLATYLGFRIEPIGYRYHPCDAMDWLYKRGLVSIAEGPDTIFCGAYNRSPYVRRYVKLMTYRILNNNDEVTQTLLHQPVLAGIWIDDSFGDMTPGMVYEGPTDISSLAKHCVIIIATEKYRGREVFIIQNCWGTKWGEGGFGRMVMDKTIYLTGRGPGGRRYRHRMSFIILLLALDI